MTDIRSVRSLLDEFFSIDNSEPTPLMEGEGRSFRVLGFNQSQRAIFVQTLMRYLLSIKAFRRQKLFCLNFTVLSPDASKLSSVLWCSIFTSFSGWTK